MAIKHPPGEHLAQAKQLLAALAPITSQSSGDAQVRATAAVAHAVLALAEQVGMVRHDLRGSVDRTDPSSFQ